MYASPLSLLLSAAMITHLWPLASKAKCIKALFISTFAPTGLETQVQAVLGLSLTFLPDAKLLSDLLL